MKEESEEFVWEKRKGCVIPYPYPWVEACISEVWKQVRCHQSASSHPLGSNPNDVLIKNQPDANAVSELKQKRHAEEFTLDFPSVEYIKQKIAKHYARGSVEKMNP